MNREEALKEFEGHPNIREAAEKSGLTQRDWLERHLDEKYKGNAEEFRRDLDRALWGEADGYGEFGLPQYDSLSSFEIGRAHV